MLTCLFLSEIGFPRTTNYGDLFYGALGSIRSEFNIFLFAPRYYVPYWHRWMFQGGRFLDRIHLPRYSPVALGRFGWYTPDCTYCYPSMAHLQQTSWKVACSIFWQSRRYGRWGQSSVTCVVVFILDMKWNSIAFFDVYMFNASWAEK